MWSWIPHSETRQEGAIGRCLHSAAAAAGGMWRRKLQISRSRASSRRAEKTEVLSEDLLQVEKRLELVKQGIDEEVVEVEEEEEES
ncbi:hypothetical protein CRUP_023276 [Coryphaenoides rupestris]|nr:hypothetical protein CRUP_023276 [Coryphaenoides rupestris]